MVHIVTLALVNLVGALCFYLLLVPEYFRAFFFLSFGSVALSGACYYASTKDLVLALLAKESPFSSSKSPTYQARKYILVFSYIIAGNGFLLVPVILVLNGGAKW